MNKKILAIFIGIILIFTAAYLLINNKTNKYSNANPTPVPSIISSPQLFPTATIVPFGLSKIIITGVSVNNFFPNSVKLDTSGDVNLRYNANYQIEFLPKFNLFVISILSSDFVNVRHQAEQDFLNILGISSNDACKLNVNIGTSYKINPDYAYKQMGLSFCGK